MINVLAFLVQNNCKTRELQLEPFSREEHHQEVADSEAIFIDSRPLSHTPYCWDSLRVIQSTENRHKSD